MTRGKHARKRKRFRLLVVPLPNDLFLAIIARIKAMGWDYWIGDTPDDIIPFYEKSFGERVVKEAVVYGAAAAYAASIETPKWEIAKWLKRVREERKCVAL